MPSAVTRLDVGALAIDLVKRTVERDGRPVQLSSTEFELLDVLRPPPGPGPQPGEAPERSLGLRLRPGNQHAGRLRQLPAQEARPAGSRAAHRDNPVGRLPAEPGWVSGSAARTGLRARLAAAVAAILIAAAAVTFVAVYRGTGARMRDQIESDLNSQGSALAAQIEAVRGDAGPNAVLRRARRSDRRSAHVHVVVPPARRARSRAPASPPTTPSCSASAGRAASPRAAPTAGARPRSRTRSCPPRQGSRRSRSRTQARSSWRQGRSIPAPRKRRSSSASHWPRSTVLRTTSPRRS